MAKKKLDQYIGLTVEASMSEEIKSRADKNERTIAAEVRYLIRKGIEAENGKRK